LVARVTFASPRSAAEEKAASTLDFAEGGLENG